MSEELWLTRDAAIERLRRFLKLSVGAAEAAFDEAMSSRTIRSRSFMVLLCEPNLERLVFRDPLDPEAWAQRDLNTINGEVSSDDLEFWVAQRLASQREVAPSQAAPRQTAEEAAKALIISLLAEEPRPPRPQISARAHAEIRDLSPKEFERAWAAVPKQLKKPVGRPKNPLGNPPF
jgi:hypothetical protein